MMPNSFVQSVQASLRLADPLQDSIIVTAEQAEATKIAWRLLNDALHLRMLSGYHDDDADRWRDWDRAVEEFLRTHEEDGQVRDR